MAQVYGEAGKTMGSETMAAMATLYAETAEALEEDENGELLETAQDPSRRKVKCGGLWCIIPPVCAALCVIKALGG